MKTVTVSVIIVNWNGSRLLGPCLDSLRAQRTLPVEVIVVDNGSTDESLAMLRAMRWPLLKIVALDRNTGFAGGNNAGLAVARGEVAALLNNDTVVDPCWIAEAAPLFRDETVGMVACKTLCMDDAARIDKTGHLIYPDGLNRGKGTGMADGPAFDTVAEALWPDGGGGFYRLSMLREIGFLDEDFFLYGEDADLGMRARWAGYRCLFQPASRLFHHRSASLGRFSPLKAYYVERNRIWVLVKNFPVSYIILSPLYSMLRYMFNLWSLLSGRGAAAAFGKSGSSRSLLGILLRALWHGWLGAPKMFSKRKSYPRRIKTAAMKRILKTYTISVRELTLID